MLKPKIYPALERAARTFVQGFLAVTTLSGLTGSHTNLLRSVEIGALAGAYALLAAFAVPPKEASKP